MRFRLICRVRHLLGGIDTQPTIQGDERIDAENALEALISWLRSKEAWIRADGADQQKIRSILHTRNHGGNAEDFSSETVGTDWQFNAEDLDLDDEELQLAGTTSLGEWEFEIRINKFRDRSELDNGLFVRDPNTLSHDALAEIVRYCQGGLFLVSDGGRDTWTLDKDMSGSDFIDHVHMILAKHHMIPEEVNGQD